MKKTLSYRLSFRFMILVATIVLFVASLYVFGLRLSIRNTQNRALVKNAILLCSEMENIDAAFVESIPLDYYISYIVFNADTLETLFTNDSLLPKLEITNGKTRHYFQKNFYTDGDLNILFCSMKLDSGIVVQTSIDIDQDSSIKMINTLPIIVLTTLLPILIISFLTALIITRQTLKPVEKITKAAQGISSSNLETLLPVSKNNDELDNLAKTFNQLFENLKKDFDREVNFTSDVSHELKTPVAGILGQANLLKRWGKNEPEQLEESLDLIINEAKSMDAIITNLLQISKLENGIIKPVKTSVNLWGMFGRIKNEFYIISPETEIFYDEQLNIEIETDMELLHQVLTALVSNSIKYGGTKIELSASCQSTKTSKAIEIRVKDNGSGFKPEVLPHVFERFYRGDKSHNRSAGGAGLGLSISQSIIKVLDGTIKADNCRDSLGAVITISL